MGSEGWPERVGRQAQATRGGLLARVWGWGGSQESLGRGRDTKVLLRSKNNQGRSMTSPASGLREMRERGKKCCSPAWGQDGVMLNYWKRSVVVAARSARQKSRQSLKQAKPQCPTIPKAMLAPSYPCNPVAYNRFTIYISLYSFQSTFTN